MKRIRSALRSALPLALLLGAAILPAPAFAEDPVTPSDAWYIYKSISYADGSCLSVFHSFYDKNARLIIEYQKDGTTYIIHKSDPGPDDPTGKGSDPIDVAALIKAGLISYTIRITPEQTPLGQWIDRNGGGFVPHWNPGDDGGDKGGGNPPKLGADGPTVKQQAALEKLINAIARQLLTTGTSMGDGTEGGSESAPTFNTSRGGTRGQGSGGNKGGGSNKYKYVGGGEAATLGARPDLVNPEPKNKTISGKSNIISPGLLEGPAGFASSGPAAIGSPISNAIGSPIGIGGAGGRASSIR